MKAMTGWRLVIVLVVAVMMVTVCLTGAQAASTQSSAPGSPEESPAPQASSAMPEETPWPVTIIADTTTLFVYQPQLDSFDGYHLEARAAVQARAEGWRAKRAHR